MLRRLPLSFSLALLAAPLAVYPWLRRGHARRLKSLLTLAPRSGTSISTARFQRRLDSPIGNHPLPLPSLRAPLAVRDYYRCRLELFLLNLKFHGRPLPEGAIAVEGLINYAQALVRSRPIALLGIHCGVVELLHKTPQTPDGRPFSILTASAFAKPLAAFMARGRALNGKSVLWNHDVAKRLKSLVVEKGVLAMMLDQHPGETEDFLDLWQSVRVPYPKRMLEFLFEKGFILIPVSTKLETEGRLSFRYHSAWDASTFDELKDRVRMFMEETIASAPEQWNWSYPKIGPTP